MRPTAPRTALRRFYRDGFNNVGDQIMTTWGSRRRRYHFASKDDLMTRCSTSTPPTWSGSSGNHPDASELAERPRATFPLRENYRPGVSRAACHQRRSSFRCFDPCIRRRSGISSHRGSSATGGAAVPRTRRAAPVACDGRLPDTSPGGDRWICAPGCRLRVHRTWRLHRGSSR
jgi:hypothetical protein